MKIKNIHGNLCLPLKNAYTLEVLWEVNLKYTGAYNESNNSSGETILN